MEEKEELNKQLAEKEQEIEDMSVSSDWQSLLILKQEIEILQTENKVLKQRNQDKISFAVEQLEKVKEKTKIFFVKATHKHNEHYSAQYNMITDFDLCFAIDNQIKQLKEIKNDTD